ncbi:hypothetical protein [Poseidonocella sp. HB161398]|uniref:hypothetical protein n=1 Tax=Poseidonocella sp. HB161398 TaxID=2320855 RepID=UPI001F0E9E17|nr:hypothetical protein [Poseidonocella sp. HB161398]
MPVSGVEILLPKVCPMGAVVFAAAMAGLHAVTGMLLGGSVWLFAAAAALMPFATTSLGLSPATVAGSVPHFGPLPMLLLLLLQMLSDGMAPRENRPEAIQAVMPTAPNIHFVILSQAIGFRGAGLATVWPPLAALAAIGGALFLPTLRQFRRFLR